MTHLDELQVCERPDVEVGCVLLYWQAAVELAVAAADGERLRPVGSAQRRRAVQPAEVRRRTKLCKHAQRHRNTRQRLQTAPEGYLLNRELQSG